MSQTNFLEELRARTAPMHKRLEQTTISQRIVSSDLDRNDYIAYLRKVHLLHQGVEGAVFPLVSHLLDDLTERRKTKVIENDLKAMEHDQATPPLIFTDDRFLEDAAFCMGILYVSEGSTLGGMVIVKNVHAALGNKAEGATGFLTVYGQETGTRWKKFLQQLGEFYNACDEAGRQRIFDGAIYGFQRTWHIFSN